MLITDPNKVPEDFDVVPTIEELKKVIDESVEESQSMRRNAVKSDNSKTLGFICSAIEELEYMLFFFCANSPTYLNELAISRRKYLEIYIDLMWVYHIYLEQETVAEELCQRFFQIGANDFLKVQNNLKFSKKDMFLGNEKLFEQHVESLSMAKKVNCIELDPSNGKHNYSNLFRKNWRAHPKLFDQTKKMKNAILHTRDRIKQLEDFFVNDFNIKNPPFLKDYDRLNQSTHWTPFGMRSLTENNKEIMYQRELNLMAGYFHDCLNLLFRYLKKDVSTRIAVIRQRFIWAS